MAALGLHCGTQASLAVVHRLSCPAVCEILVPRPGIEATSPALEGGFLTTGSPEKSLGQSFIQGSKYMSKARLLSFSKLLSNKQSIHKSLRQALGGHKKFTSLKRIKLQLKKSQNMKGKESEAGHTITVETWGT